MLQQPVSSACKHEVTGPAFDLSRHICPVLALSFFKAGKQNRFTKNKIY